MLDAQVLGALCDDAFKVRVGSVRFGSVQSSIRRRRERDLATAAAGADPSPGRCSPALDS